MGNEAKDRRRGPTPKSPDTIRKHRIGVYLSDPQLEELSKRAGTHIPKKMEGERSGGDTAARRKIANYIRAAAFGALPPVVPAVNERVWIELAPVLANLNQIAKKLNSGGKIDDYAAVMLDEVVEINDMLKILRPKLLAGHL